MQNILQQATALWMLPNANRCKEEEDYRLRQLITACNAQDDMLRGRIGTEEFCDVVESCEVDMDLYLSDSLDNIDFLLGENII